MPALYENAKFLTRASNRRDSSGCCFRTKVKFALPRAIG